MTTVEIEDPDGPDAGAFFFHRGQEPGSFAPILRAGVGFLDGMMNLVPSARVAHIGLYRVPHAGEHRIYFKAPKTWPTGW